jgi:hypothetical protein
MSDIKQLKSRLDQIGRDARSTAGNLAAFRGRFNRQAADVERTIGGTATGVDKNMIETLQAAERQVSTAISALERVATIAGRYGASL